MGVILSGAVLLAACADVSRFERSALVAHGERFDGVDEPQYYSVRVNFERGRDARVAQARIRLKPEAPDVAIADLTPDWVKRWLPLAEAPPAWVTPGRSLAGEEAFTGGGFHVRFIAGRLASVGICSHCAGGRTYPVVGTPAGRLYALPLTRQALIDVFGPAEREYSVNEVRY